jgi:quercetin dioxygenase-like cupin family protein
MKIIHSGKVKSEERSGGIFIGTVKIRSLIDPEMGSKDFRSAIVTFPPGTKNKLHTHSGEQILFVTNGKGIVATENEEVEVTKGDIILIPANEKHWHGATADSIFSHLYVTPTNSKTTF